MGLVKTAFQITCIYERNTTNAQISTTQKLLNEKQVCVSAFLECDSSL